MTIDVDDSSKFEYLNPMWELLANIGEQTLKKKDIIEQTCLDPQKVEPLLQEMTTVFLNKLSRKLLNIFSIIGKDPDEWYNKHLKDSWVWDKFMLLGTRVDLEQPNPLENNPLFDKWKIRWLEERGM